ncbi:hypothetical protein PWYN_25080 [Paenibacillus wynnii]|uniref:Uncharacterized protein n=2 Tax=Paenibacillus wynnii TaxID=268407 RepID=A0A098M8H8_9BACL|nr:hypothetical protein PWYN_25080 [Paenibacillus wynnii]
MAAAEMPPELRETLKSVCNLLSMDRMGNSSLWLLGGSCGLLLHNVPLARPPRDIDLYADLGETDSLHNALSHWSLDHPEENYSKDCFSVMSHYRFGTYPIELVCGFKICSGYSQYIVETSLLLKDAPLTYFEGIGYLRLMPLAHEFVFNILRGRSDRYESIAAVMRMDLASHLPLLQSLSQRNTLEESHLRLLEQHLSVSLSLV